MVKRTGGARRKTRNLYKKKSNKQGKISLRDSLQTFENGQAVLLRLEPAQQHGVYYRRFHAKTGVVVGQQGSCYQVEITDGKKTKKIIVHPVHLRKIQ